MLKTMKNRFAKDIFAKNLGIEIVDARPGYGKVTLRVTKDMLNGPGITHGAVVFAVADLAFAVASNSHERVSLGLNMNISYVKATTEGTLLTGEATEDSLTNRTGLYRVVISDEEGDTVAVAEGLAYRTAKKYDGGEGV